jgi:prepilin-type N-terminal cleavage/methylation domain-containing protein
MSGRPLPRSGQAGFTLIEMSVSLVLLFIGMMMAAELLMESAQLFATTSREANEMSVPLAIAGLRADAQGADFASAAITEEGDLAFLSFVSRDAAGREQVIRYLKNDTLLLREVNRIDGAEQPLTVWTNVTHWKCEINGGLVDLEIDYIRRALPRSPLPGLPVDRGPRAELRTERMFFLTRGRGLGSSW